jgi:broad specificity phosphatase PhoE
VARSLSYVHFIFIRHGQASFGQANYDELSSLGCIQMQNLGRAFKFFSKSLDSNNYVNIREQSSQDLEHLSHICVHVGTLQRQHHSLQNFFESNLWVQQQNITQLKKRITSHQIWNEFEFQKILKHYQKHLSAEPQTQLAITRGGIHTFHYLIAQWIQNNLPAHLDKSIPTWSEFQQGIVSHFQSIISQSSSTRYHLCFTSAGVITAVISHYLNLHSKQSLALLMKIKNSSTTHLKIATGLHIPQVYLSQLNNTQHLAASEITFY